MPLTDTAIKNAKPADKPMKLFDGGGLYLELSPAGGKLWRLKYRFGGKEKQLSFGAYPAVSLKEAREHRDEDPGEAKKALKAAEKERAAHTFEAVARDWFEKWKTGVSDSTAQSQWERLAKHIMPALGLLQRCQGLDGASPAGGSRHGRHAQEMQNRHQPNHAIRHPA